MEDNQQPIQNVITINIEDENGVVTTTLKVPLGDLINCYMDNYYKNMANNKENKIFS